MWYRKSRAGGPPNSAHMDERSTSAPLAQHCHGHVRRKLCVERPEGCPAHTLPHPQTAHPPLLLASPSPLHSIHLRLRQLISASVAPAPTSECICRCLLTSSGKGYRLALYASHICGWCHTGMLGGRSKGMLGGRSLGVAPLTLHATTVRSIMPIGVPPSALTAQHEHQQAPVGAPSAHPARHFKLWLGCARSPACLIAPLCIPMPPPHTHLHDLGAGTLAGMEHDEHALLQLVACGRVLVRMRRGG